MATWITHMRAAAHFMGLHPSLDNREFLVGNIAPDGGVLNPDRSTYTPDKAVTHFYAPGTMRIDAQRFAEEYLRERDARYPFYLGYYFHLLTDAAFSRWYARKRQEPLYAEGLARDPQFIWEIKRDWYGQDRLYLQDHPDFVFYTMFAPIEDFPNIYFDFYPPQAFTLHVRRISEFYLDGKEDPQRAFPYLAKEEMDGLVEDAIQTLEYHLHTENLL
jgi:hypothetical protein